MSSKSSSEGETIAEFDLKHRVTGAAVLLFLGALVLPWLLGPPSEASKVEAAEHTPTVSEIEPAEIISSDAPTLSGSVDEIEETVYISKITPLKPSSEGESAALQALANEEQQKLDQQTKRAAEDAKLKQQAIDKKAAEEKALADSKKTKQETEAQERDRREKELQAALAAETASLNANTNKVDVGWVVQVGLFTEKSRAIALISELKNKGFNASSSVVDTNRGKNTGTRVWLGPYAKRVSAINEQKRLKAKAAKDGFIRVYP